MSTMAVAIVNYNTREHLRACLTTVVRNRPAEVVVVDNASSDGSADMVRAEFPEVRLIASGTNPGYGGGANRAIAACRAPYVLLLNSDTRLEDGALEVLSAYLDQHPEAAVVGPRLAYPDGTLQQSCFPFPTPLDTFLHLSHLGPLLARLFGLREIYLRTWSHRRARAVPWVLGAALALRREPFENVGGFDESFFMYSEEVALCYVLHKRGWQTHFAPVTTVTHVRGASTSNQHVEMEIRKTRSTWHFYRRHYPPRRIWQLKLVLAPALLLKIARDTLRPGFDPRRRAEQLRMWCGILADLWAQPRANV